MKFILYNYFLHLHLSKMADQIEMSTANAPDNVPAQNIFRTNINFMGKPIPVNTILTFNTNQPRNNNAGTDLPVKVNTTWTPFNISMAMAKDRENTFISWPKQMVQKPMEMVSSGFYYTGCGDVVQCFFCGICLKHWSRTDTVNVEHRKHSPECKFNVMLRRF